jgi:hypothetical protein
MTWNTGTNKFDVAAPYILPIATNATLGGVKSGNDISVNPTTGLMSLSKNDIYLNGTTNKEYSWFSSNSSLGRVATAGAYSTSSIINDLVLRSAGNLILQSGTGASALIINTTNQAIFRNAVGVGLTTISAGTIFDAGGIFKIAADAGTERLTITSTGVQVNNTLNISSSGINAGGLLRFGGFADDSSADLAIIQNREYATNKGELLLFRGNDITGTSGPDRIRMRAGAIAFDTYPAASTSSTTENIRMYIDGNGNVGIDKTNPSERLDVNGNILCSGFLQGAGGGGGFRIERPDNWVRLRVPGTATHLDFAAGQLYSHSTVTSVGDTNVSSNLSVGGTSFLRNTYIYSSNEASSIALYFGTPHVGNPTGASKSAIIAQAITSWSRHNLCFCLNTAADNSTNASLNDIFMRLNHAGYIEMFRDAYVSGNFYLNTSGSFYGGFYSVPMTNSDYLSIQNNTSLNTTTNNWIRVAYGSFTAFHRSYTDDSLFDEENPDIFKNNYMGRVVIATGKIKTDLTKPKEKTEIEIDPNPDIPKNDPEEWYSVIDKDGISVEDAIPVIQLSRKKKDKRVFGVLGDPKRRTNNINRLIVNSIGEGAICVCNINGNIENGDYIQSSDLLGYGEKQDDDLLHNYTIAKSTIDCTFELNSPYYQCYEIENSVRVAFIACTYHCG